MDVKQEIETGDAPVWVQVLARGGLSAKGVVYLMLGALAFLSALVPGERPTDSTGAMIHLQHVAVGRPILAVLAAGLGCYAGWRLLQALVDPEHRHTDESFLERLPQRVVFLVSAAFYAGMMVDALVHTLGGWPVDTHGALQGHWTARVLHWPLGPWLVAGFGIGLIVFGLGELYRAATERLRQRLGAHHPGWVPLLWVGRAGIVARAVVFGMAGTLLVRAAWLSQAGRTQGIAAALDALRQEPYGPWLLGVVAAGLCAFGLFQFMQALLSPVDAL